MSSAKHNRQTTQSASSSDVNDVFAQTAAPRMQQFLHGLRLSAANDMVPANDLEQLAILIDFNRRSNRDENNEQHCA